MDFFLTVLTGGLVISTIEQWKPLQIWRMPVLFAVGLVCAYCLEVQLSVHLIVWLSATTYATLLMLLAIDLLRVPQVSRIR
jgi:phosphatidylserine synthase